MRTYLLILSIFHLLFLHGACLVHTKSFLLQIDFTVVQAVIVQNGSLFHTTGIDIVQRDTDTGLIRRTLRAHSQAVQTMVLVDRQTLVSVAWDDLLVVWDLPTGSIIRRINLTPRNLYPQKLSFTDSRIIVGNAGNSLTIANYQTGRILNNLQTGSGVLSILVHNNLIYIAKSGPPYVVTVSVLNGLPDGSYNALNAQVNHMIMYKDVLYTAGEGKVVVAWNIYDITIIRTFNGHQFSIQALVAQAGYLFSGDANAVIIKWNIETGELVKRFLPITEGFLLTMAIDDALYSGSSGAIVVKRDIENGDILDVFSGFNKKLRAIARWKNVLISGGEDGRALFWDTDKSVEEPFWVLYPNYGSVYALMVRDDSLYSGGANAIVAQFDLISFQMQLNFVGHQDTVLTLDADDKYLFSAGKDLDIREWNITTGASLRQFLNHNSQVGSIQKQSNFLLSSSWDTTAVLWDLNGGTIVKVYQIMETVYTAIMIGDFLYAGCSTLVMFDKQSGSMIFTAKGVTTVYEVIQDSVVLYTGGLDPKIHALRQDTLEIVAVFRGHSDSVLSLALDKTGVLYSAAYDGSIKKWDMASKRVAYSFELVYRGVTRLHELDGRLVVGLRNGRINVYNIDDGIVQYLIPGHPRAITSLITFNGSLYSTGLDGAFRKFTDLSKQPSILLNTTSAPLLSLSQNSRMMFLLVGESDIISYDPKILMFTNVSFSLAVPLTCLASTESMVLAGSRSGNLIGWDISSQSLQFNYAGHNGRLNALALTDKHIFSSSDDQTIIQWSIDKVEIKRKFVKSSSNLGHLGPVNDLSVCNNVLFSAGSDLVTRRWNLETGKHEDIYVGHSNPVIALLCYNGSLFSGSQDFSVLMYRPSFPQAGSFPTTTSSTLQRQTRRDRQVKLSQNERTGNSSSVLLSVVYVGISILAGCLLVIFLWNSLRKKAIGEPKSPETDDQSGRTDSSVTDLETLMNTSLGLSKHAALEFDSKMFRPSKKIASGGGGNLYISQVLSPSLAKTSGNEVIQKIVHVSSKQAEEMFHNEVAIMVMLGVYPHFCKIYGYTLQPLSMILKFYTGGSLSDFIKKTSFTARVDVKILREIASGLSVMHSHYLAHCDMKPQNVLVEILDNVPSIAISDFGITRILSDKILASKQFNVRSTKGLSVHYAAPEAFTSFRSKDYVRTDFKKCDVYSFSCILYEMLGRRFPWNQ